MADDGNNAVGQGFGGAGIQRGAMPLQRLTGVPKFNGKDLEDWLEQYEAAALAYGVTDAGKVNGLIWYLSREEPLNIYDWAKRLDSYKAKDWTALLTDLREAFPDDDKRDKYTMADLHQITRVQEGKAMTTTAELADYRVRFERVAKWLKDRKLINTTEMADAFYSGLPKTLRDTLLVEERIRAENQAKAGMGSEANTPGYLDIFERVKQILGADNFYAISNRRLAKERGEVPAHSVQLGDNVPGTVISDPVAELTRKFDQLSVQMAMVQQENQRLRQNVASATPPAAATYAGGRQTPPHVAGLRGATAVPFGQPVQQQLGAAPWSGNNPPQFPCLVCKGPAPYHWKSQCPELQRYLNEGVVRLNPATRRVEFTDGSEVPTHAQGMKFIIEERIAARRGQTINANPVRLSWGVPEVSSGPRNLVTASAGDFDAMPAEKRGREVSDDAGGQHKRRQVGVPIVEIPARSRGQAADDMSRRNQAPAARGASDNAARDEAMPEATDSVVQGEKAKRVPANTKWSNVKTRYADEAKNLPTMILDSKLELPIGTLLALSNDLTKTMQEDFRLRKVPVPTTTWKAKGTAAMKGDESDEQEEDRQVHAAASAFRAPLYSGVVGKIRLTVGGIEVNALWDTGSEVNLVPKSTYIKMGVPLSEGEHFLTDANGNTSKLFGYLENVSVNCGSVNVRQHFYVQHGAHYDCLLGMPFLQATEARTWFDDAGSLWVRLHGDGGEVVSACITRPDDPRNMTHMPTRRTRRRRENDEDESGEHNSNTTSFTAQRAVLTLAEAEKMDKVEDELEWPIQWDKDSVGNWAEHVEAVEARRERRNIVWNGHRVELDNKEVLQEVREGTIVSEAEVSGIVKATHNHDVYAMELDALANWEATVPVKQLRGWIADWKREARKDEQGDKGDIFQVDAKYKPKGVKVVPVDTQLPDEMRSISSALPPLSRDPYQTPLSPQPPEFEYGGRLTKERMDKITWGPPGWLNEEEIRLGMSVLKLREKALAFEESEMGLRKTEYGPATITPTVEHQPWQENPFPVPHSIRKKVVALFRKQMAAGVFEPSQAPYASKWFPILKKNGDVRLIMDSTRLNKVTIRDAGLPPNVRDYVDEMVGYVSYFLIDLFSGYLQEPLDVSSRDLTTIRTPIGLLRLTRLPMGGTNSVAVFQRRVAFILHEEIPDICLPFIDDIGGKGLATTEGDRAIADNPKIRQWVWEHFVRFERILFRLEEAGLTASGPKLVPAAPAISILGTHVSAEGKRADIKKVDKLRNWPVPKSVSDVRRWYGLYNYLRHFVEGAQDAEARIRAKLVKGREDQFEWTDEDQKAMDVLKEALGRDIVLKTIDYGTGGGQVIVAVDSSQTAAGVAIWQLDKAGRRQPIVFDSIPMTDTESRYSQPKLELCGVFKTLKRHSQLLFGIHFILEVDASFLKVIVGVPELPTAVITRWVSYIKGFDFTVEHLPGKEHVVPDALSRRARMEGEEEAVEGDIGDEDIVALAAHFGERGGGWTSTLSRVRAAPAAEEQQQDEWPDPVDDETLERMPREWRQLAIFLQSGKRTDDTTRDEWRRVLSRAPGFRVRDGRLWRRHRGVEVEVLFDDRLREEAAWAAHEASGHRGRDATFRRLADRFWWPKMYDYVKKHLRSCEDCQFRHGKREVEALQPTHVSRLFQKVGVDLVHIGEGCGQYKYLIVARDDLTGWPEARPLRRKQASDVAKFLWEDVISRFGTIGFIVSDNGTEMKAAVDLLLDKYDIPHIVTSPYHPEANAMVERGHAALVEAILRTCRDKPASWHLHLHSALWADRMTYKRTTGFSPYELLYGAEPVLPVDVEMTTWLCSEWKRQMTTDELLEARIRQLERRDDDMDKARERQRSAREKSSTYMDEKRAHRLRTAIKVGELVLVHDTSLDKQWSKRVQDRWRGPYRVRQRLARKTYLLEELDGTHMKTPVPASRLRRFYLRPKAIGDVEDDFELSDDDGDDDDGGFEDEGEAGGVEDDSVDQDGFGDLV